MDALTHAGRYDDAGGSRAMAREAALLRRGLQATAMLVEQITDDGWTAQSACDGWTVRQAADHLTGALKLLTRYAAAEPIDHAEVDAQRQADTDHLGTDPAAAFRAVAERALEVFGRPGALEREVPFINGPATGATLASISLLETTIHGWDVAVGAGLRYEADDEIVQALWSHARDGVGDEQRRAGMFADPLPVMPTADPFTILLAHLGRRA